MGEDGAWAAGEDRCDVVAFAGEKGAGDEGVDALVDAVKAAGGCAVTDRSCAETEGAELIQGDDRVLPSRHGGKSLVERRPPRVRFSRIPWHAPHRCPNCVTRGSRRVPTL